MNKSFLDGNITGDPKVYAPDGSEYTCLTFSIANNDEKKKVGNEWESVASFFELKFWTKNPTHWIQKIVKGARCYVEAIAKQEMWEKDGVKNSKVIFNVQGFPNINSKEAEPF